MYEINVCCRHLFLSQFMSHLVIEQPKMTNLPITSITVAEFYVTRSSGKYLTTALILSYQEGEI